MGETARIIGDTMGLMTKQEFIMWAREVGPKYQFSEGVVRQLSEVELIAVVGPTGAGKTTLIDKLDIPIVKSDVTRTRRADEKRDDTYNFRVDYDVIKQQIEAGEYVQFVVSAYGEFYGTHISSYPKQGECTMAIVAGAIPSFEKFNFKKLSKIYVMPPGYVEWLHRIGTDRSDDLDDRLQEARTSLKMAMHDDTYNFILNDDLDTAANDIKKVLAGEKLSDHRLQLVSETANLLLKHLGDQDDDDLYVN